MGGGKNYSDVYSKYKPDVKFTSYVDKYPDLKEAWKRIEDDPNHPDSQYWIKRGATSKEAFGRAHAAEAAALKGGTYMGATKYTPGSEALKGLLGDTGNTRYEQFLTSSSSDSSDDGGPGPRSGGGSPGDKNYPMNILDYTPPSQMEGIPLEFQPWIQPDNIPDNIWSYKPPTLEEWDVSDRVKWDWATKPASEYNPAKTASDSGTGEQGAEGNSYDADGYEIRPDGTRTGAHISQMDPLGIGDKILNWMGADSAGVQRAKAFAKEAGIDPNTVGMGVASPINEIGMKPS